MTDKLTPEQEKTLEEVKNYWINNFLNSGTDLKLDDIKDSVYWIYEKLELKKPAILIADSIFTQQLMYNMIKTAFEDDTTVSTDNGGKKIDSEEWDKVYTEMKEQLKDQKDIPIFKQIKDKIGAKLSLKVKGKLANKKLDFIWYGRGSGYVESYFLSVFDYFEKNGIKYPESFNQWKNLCSKQWSAIWLHDFAIICKLPIRTKTDENGMLHSLNEKAIEWRDGYGNYYIHGVGFEKDLWDKVVNRKMKAAEIMKDISNVEQRFIALQIYGEDKLFKEFKPKLIDSYKLKRMGTTYNLYEIENLIPNRQLKLLKYGCASTDRTWYKQVEDKFTTAKEAIAFYHNCTPEEYEKVLQQT